MTESWKVNKSWGFFWNDSFAIHHRENLQGPLITAVAITSMLPFIHHLLRLISDDLTPNYQLVFIVEPPKNNNNNNKNGLLVRLRLSSNIWWIIEQNWCFIPHPSCFYPHVKTTIFKTTLVICFPTAKIQTLNGLIVTFLWQVLHCAHTSLPSRSWPW